MAKKKRKGRYEYVGGFVFMDENDKRAAEYEQERSRTGVSPDETWSLDSALARFMVPRLKAFRKHASGHPVCFKSTDAWLRAVRKMEMAFKLIIEEGEGKVLNEKQNRQEEEGLDLFRKHMRSLWW